MCVGGFGTFEAKSSVKLAQQKENIHNIPTISRLPYDRVKIIVEGIFKVHTQNINLEEKNDMKILGSLNKREGPYIQTRLENLKKRTKTIH